MEGMQGNHRRVALLEDQNLGVARDDVGSVVWCFAKQSPEFYSIEAAEAMALRKGMEMASFLGIQRGLIDDLLTHD